MILHHIIEALPLIPLAGEALAGLGTAIGAGASALGGAAGLTALGSLAGAGAAAYSAFGPKPSVPSAPAAAPPIQAPTGSQTSNVSGTGPSFLAAAAAPAANQSAGSKSLLGQ